MHRRISDEEFFEMQGFIGPGGGRVAGRELFTSADHQKFQELIAPLESRAGKPLNGPGLRRCQRAFKENPASFAQLAAEAFDRGTRNCVGLLVRMVNDADERWEPRP